MDPRRLLEAIPLFESLSEEQLAAIHRKMIGVDLPDGTVVLREGGAPAGFYLLLSGSVLVVKNYGHRLQKQLNRLEAGSWFGEMSLLDDGPPSATVVVAERMQGLALMPADFAAVIAAHPGVSHQLLATLSRRVRRLEDSGMREMIAAQEAIILSLAKLAESRDPETGAHLDRISHYCRLLARAAAAHPAFGDQIDEEFVDTIAASSPLHDIGKVGIPDAVLRAPRRLTAEETLVMQRHPEIGAATIRRAIAKSPGVTFLEMGHDIALSHHERVDGTGYPAGLAGDAIPLCARIMAVADVFDAFRSDRVYRKGVSHEEARQILRDGSGTQFDPRLVELFLGREQELQELSALYRER
jgi:HD-GYP domain-containing protein (c-di-GMP phosphodiesterase class II)